MTVDLSKGILNRVGLIFKMERKKYQRKGLVASLAGFAILFSLIFISREIGIRLWPEHIEDKGWFLLKGAILIHYCAETWTFLLMLPGYLNLLPYYEKYKINKEAKWPWHRPNWKIMRRKLFYNLIINQVFVFPMFVSVTAVLEVKQRFTDFPSFGEMLLHIYLVYLMDDIFFYWGHRMFHQFKNLYKMHKIHHQYDKIFTFATEYFHPFDYAVANVMPSALGLLLLGGRAHCLTYFFWVGYKVSLSTQGHSGYEFPWSPTRILPLVLGPCYHDHHHSHNIGNYSGSCYLWDLLMGTGDHFMERFLRDDNNVIPALT